MSSFSTLSAPPPCVRDKETGTIGVGVIGLGRSGTFFHCRPIDASPHFALVAVHDVRAEVAQRIAAEHGCRHYEFPEDLLGDPGMDLAVLAVPTRDHAELALKAIRRGVPVLVEKPFATSSGEAAMIFEAGRAAGVPVYAYHNRRFDPDVRALARILESGVLGDVVKVSINLHAYTRRRDWQTLRAMGGGALSNWGAHAVDWCFRLFGSDISLLWACLFHVLNPGDAEDGFLLQLKSGRTTIQIEYLNCASIPLPKWHVVGRHGTVRSEGKNFHLRVCDPALLVPIEAEHSCASDGKYGIDENLRWREETIPWEHWDNCPPFLDALHGHMAGTLPAPVPVEHVIAQIRLMEEVRERAEFLSFHPTRCNGSTV